MIHTAPTPDVVALVRRLYQDGELVKDICARTGLSLGTAYGCLDGRFPDGTDDKPAPIPRRRAGVRIKQRLGSRAALIARMWRTAELQVEEIESRAKAAGLEVAERESNARTLSIVVKTLNGLTAVDEAERQRKKGARQSQDDDDSDEEFKPRDIDEFRRELARKIESLVAARRGGGDPGGS
jgi:hypothetical protein